MAMKYKIQLLPEALAQRVVLFCETWSKDLQSNDARIMHKLAKHYYRKNRAFGKLYFSKETM